MGVRPLCSGKARRGGLADRARADDSQEYKSPAAGSTAAGLLLWRLPLQARLEDIPVAAVGLRVVKGVVGRDIETLVIVSPGRV